MLAGRQPFGVLRWFQLFFFHFSHFSFATSICGLVFQVFLCHRYLWSVLSFFSTHVCVQSLSFTAFCAVGILVRLFVFALLALVSGYQLSLSFWYHAVRLLLVSFILGDLNWNLFQVRYPVDSPTNSTLKQPHLVFCHKVYKIALSEVLATQMGMTEVQHQSQFI